MSQSILRLEIPSNCGHLPVAAAFIRSAAALAGFDEENIEAIEIASMEAVENVFDHARSDSNGTATLSVLQDKGDFIVEIRDRGIPWPPEVLSGKIGFEMPPPESPRGRGLAMMRALMDRVIPHQEPDGTKTLRLVKKLLRVEA